MSTPFPPELMTTFRALSEVIYDADSHDQVYAAICGAAVGLVDACDHSSLMVLRRDRMLTAGTSDDVALHIDDLERELGEGPCVDALDESEPDQHHSPDLAADSRWPSLARRILEETPVRGAAGFRIRLDGAKGGALNVFSDRQGALTLRALDQAATLAAFASVALAAQQRGEEAHTLKRGLESNREIGKAVGLIMAMHRLDDEQAFAMLSKVSQEMNIKLAEVAAQVIAHHRHDRPSSRS